MDDIDILCGDVEMSHKTINFLSKMEAQLMSTMVKSCSKSLGPATEALDKAFSPIPNHEIRKSTSRIRRKSTQARRGSLDSAFDMAAFERATKQVEESIAFPAIDWSFNEDDNDEEIDISKGAKRRCQGLTRNDGFFDLCKLSTTVVCRERRGSTGSML